MNGDLTPPMAGSVDPEAHFDPIEWELWLDGVEPAAPRRAHLDACPGCAADGRTLRALSSALGDLPQRDLPPGLATRVLARMADARAASAPTGLPRWLVWWGRPPGLAVAATLFAITVFSVQVLRGREEPWTGDNAWLAGLPSAEDPLEGSWSPDPGFEPMSAPRNGATEGDSGRLGGTGS